MASGASTYDERLGLADCFEEYKAYLSQQHYDFLAHEALEESRGGAGKLKYILALARRCKTGALSADILAKQIDKEYHVTPLPQEEQEVGDEEETVEGHRVIDTEMNETDVRDEQEQTKEAEDKQEKVRVCKFGAPCFCAASYVHREKMLHTCHTTVFLLISIEELPSS